MGTDGDGINEEFRTVDLIVKSKSKTHGVDAFALSLIKAEKQARRLLTYLIYQHEWCGPADKNNLKAALESSKNVYFSGVLVGHCHRDLDQDSTQSRPIEDPAVVTSDPR